MLAQPPVKIFKNSPILDYDYFVKNPVVGWRYFLPGPQLLSPPEITLPLGWEQIILLGHIDTGVSSLPKATTLWSPARTGTRDLW